MLEITIWLQIVSELPLTPVQEDIPWRAPSTMDGTKARTVIRLQLYSAMGESTYTVATSFVTCHLT